MRVDLYHHYPHSRELIMANEALQSELSNLASVLADKDATIASQSAALEAAAGGDADAVSSAVSSAVDAEDSDIASSISSILSQG